MLSKNVVKYIQTLDRKKNRDEQGVFIAEGPKLAEEILTGDFEILHIYALPDWLPVSSTLQTITTITEGDLNRISQLQTPNKVFIIAKQKHPLNPPETRGKLILALDGLQDPGNMGTIIRTADWFGIDQIICSPDCVEIYNPKVVQATMGSICRVNVWYKPLSEWLTEIEVPVYGALLSGKPLRKEKITEGVLVMGNESKGIRPEILPLISHPLTIPRIGYAESLNVSVATGIILSQIRG